MSAAQPKQPEQQQHAQVAKVPQTADGMQGSPGRMSAERRLLGEPKKSSQRPSRRQTRDAQPNSQRQIAAAAQVSRMRIPTRKSVKSSHQPQPTRRSLASKRSVGQNHKQQPTRRQQPKAPTRKPTAKRRPARRPTKRPTAKKQPTARRQPTRKPAVTKQPTRKVAAPPPQLTQPRPQPTQAPLPDVPGATVISVLTPQAPALNGAATGLALEGGSISSPPSPFEVTQEVQKVTLSILSMYCGNASRRSWPVTSACSTYQLPGTV